MNSGAYQIYIEIKADCSIKIGSLGTVDFKKGIYVYTGSAMRNLAQRVDRHRRKEKKLRWHIDYLLDNDNTEIIKTDVFSSGERQECLLNQSILRSRPGAQPVPGFGSSDCRQCEGHLIYIQS
jgi:sugar fermentation stimulation protein A